jgi:hypothetical protein
VTGFLGRVRRRLPPAAVLARGIVLLGSGLLSYTQETEAAPVVRAIPTYDALPSSEAEATPAVGGLPPFDPSRVATRIAIPRLGIDLPVMLQTPGYGTYPLCDVALYRPDFGQPGSGRPTFIYGHSKAGMLRPLLLQSRITNGEALVGVIVEVWTSDDWLFLYRIDEIHRHVRDMLAAEAADTEQLWIQTPEGPDGVRSQVQVVADLVSAQPADHADANPVPHPRVCGG